MGTEDNKICTSISPRGTRPEEDVQRMRGDVHLVETLRHSLLCAWCNSVRVPSLKPVWSPLSHAAGLDPLSKGPITQSLSARFSRSGLGRFVNSPPGGLRPPVLSDISLLALVVSVLNHQSSPVRHPNNRNHDWKRQRRKGTWKGRRQASQEGAS